jgi:hypothetical protein
VDFFCIQWPFVLDRLDQIGLRGLPSRQAVPFSILSTSSAHDSTRPSWTKAMGRGHRARHRPAIQVLRASIQGSSSASDEIKTEPITLIPPRRGHIASPPWPWYDPGS